MWGPSPRDCTSHWLESHSGTQSNAPPKEPSAWLMPCWASKPLSPPHAPQRGLSSGPCSSPTDSNSVLGSARSETRIIAADTSTASAATSPHQGSTYTSQHGHKVEPPEPSSAGLVGHPGIMARHLKELTSAQPNRLAETCKHQSTVASNEACLGWAGSPWLNHS